MNQIHSTAFVDPAAVLGRNVSVGPFCHVGAGVEIGDDCELLARVTLLGPSRFGARNRFFPGCVLGTEPQDLKYRGGPTRLDVGDDNTFRETVTANRGTEVDRLSGGVTHIGSHNLFMIGVHIAHDCDLGDHIILANGVLLAGHVCLENCVNVGGGTAMHHFVTVGRNAFVAGMTRVTHDAPPYMKTEGYGQLVRGVNSTGMKRWGIAEESARNLKTAFKVLYARRTSGASLGLSERLAELRSNGLSRDQHVQYLADFLLRKLDRGIYGRVRESERADSRADIRKFYDQDAKQSGAGVPARTDLGGTGVPARSEPAQESLA